MIPDRRNIRFNVLRNALYHTGRRLAFERWNRWCNFAVVLLGAAAMGDVLRLAHIENGQAITGIAVAVVGAAQLVFDFGGKARDHQTLQREYYHLLAEIEETLSPTEKQLGSWYGKMIMIAGDEPPVLRALDAKAYNDALGATEDFDAGERLYIPLLHQLFGSILPFEGHHYQKLSEMEGVHQSAVE